MANFVFVPQIFDGFINHLWLSGRGSIWVREDAVINTSRRRVMLTSLHVALIDAMLEQRNNPGDYFGVAFSVYHCAIVRVVKDACTTTFSHMTTPQFLSSLPADSPSTPGITIPARLGYCIDPALFVCVMELCGSGDGQVAQLVTRNRSLRELIMTMHRISAVQCFLLKSGKKLLLISICTISSPSAWS